MCGGIRQGRPNPYNWKRRTKETESTRTREEQEQKGAEASKTRGVYIYMCVRYYYPRE